MHLMTSLFPIGSHLAGWRHKDAYPRTTMRLDVLVEQAKLAERGKFDMLFLADGNAVRAMDDRLMFVANTNTDRPAAYDPLMVFAAISQHTRDIGLFATAVTTYDEPYLLARRFGSLDHLSHGRACWNIVTGNYEGDAVNFGRAAHVPRHERYERADEFVTICKGLWDSWADDAFPEDKASGHFLDPGKLQRLNHVGKHFSVQGPLNVARLPQGYPVLSVAGQSEPGRQLAARHADLIFSVALTKPDAQLFYRDLKQRTALQGRNPDHVRILPGMTAYVGRTEAEAEELYGELQDMIPPEVGVASLSKFCRMDLSGYDLDGPLPDLSAEVIGMASYRLAIDQLAKKERLTIRSLYKQIIPSAGHVVFKGSHLQVADQMEDWFRSKACDGFNVGMPVLPRSLQDFVDLVIPELQRRGLFREAYPGGTLRDTLGIPVPGRGTNPNGGWGLGHEPPRA